MKNYQFKWLLLSIILSLASINTVWAKSPEMTGFGFQFRDDNGTWYKTGTKGDGGIMDVNLGSKTNLKVVYVYANSNKNDGNLCTDNNYLKYEIYGNTGVNNWGGDNRGSADWNNGKPVYKWGTENGTNAINSNFDLVANRLPGDYRMEFFFSYEGNNSSGCGTWYDCKYGGGNWKFSWTIPDPTITITGASSLVAGTSTNISASISNYPVGATLTRVDVTGNLASSMYATGTGTSVTVNSVTPNASGANGIKVTVTVTYGTAGSKTYDYYYNVTPPAVSDYTITPGGTGYLSSGSGTEGSPYLVTYNGTLTLGLSGATKAYADGNSAAEYSTNGGSNYGTTGSNISLTRTNVTTTSNADWTFKARLTNSSLHGAVNEKTVYWKVPTYTITLNSNGGSANGSATATHGTTTLTSISAPTKTGYHVEGYYTNDATPVKIATDAGALQGSTAYTDASNKWNSLSNQTLYAHWTANQYTITLNGNGGTGHTSSVKATYNSSTLSASITNPTKTGYTFAGWYSGSGGTGTLVIDASGNLQSGVTISSVSWTNGSSQWVKDGGVTLYAKWTANKYTITLEDYSPDSWGTYLTGGCDTKVDNFVVEYNTKYFDCYLNEGPTKVPYDFNGWYSGEGGAGDQIVSAYGALASGSTAYTDGDGKWNYAGDPTIYAKWTLRLSGYSDIEAPTGALYSAGTITFTYKSSSTSAFTAATRTGYILQGYWTAEDGEKVVNADGTLVENVDGWTDEDGKWIYSESSTPSLYTKWEPITYTVAFDKDNISKYVYDAEGSMDPVAATYDEYVTMPANTFTREGYSFRGWSKTSDGTLFCLDEATSVKNLTSTDGATVTLYALWTGDEHTVTFNPREGTMGGSNTADVRVGSTYGSGFVSGNLPTPYAPSGYEFDGWYTSATGGTKVTAATIMTATSDHTLYAHYNKINRVYFKNTIGWTNVYVTYDAYWNSNGHGTGNDKGTGNHSRTYHKMTHLSGDVYYDDIPSGFLTTWAYNIAFNDRELLTGGIHAPTTGNYENYNTGEVVFRIDFDSIASMFVPRNDNTNNVDGNYQKNGAQYISTGYKKEYGGTDGDPDYNSGYWRTYNDVFSGYKLTYSVHDADSWTSKKLYAPTPSDSVFSYTLTLPANSDYDYAIYKDYGSNGKSDQWRTGGDEITSANCTNLKLYCQPKNGWFKTTVAGDYTFKITMKSDGHMYLTVEYPFAVNDYRVVYNWEKGANSYSQVSEIIRCKAEAKDTISVFIHSKDSVKTSPSDTRSLYIQKCTAISAAGVPTWTDHSEISLPDTTKSGKTSGVYVFALEQNAGGTGMTGSYVEPYKGKYYIRTAAADGGWDMYKYRSNNQMTYSAYSLTQTIAPPYSHYYCRFIESTSTDITYTIATDWSPSISDTLIGDALIGGVGNKTLPSAANVRFSWNRETNGLRRAYIKPAQGAGNERFLVLHGSNTNLLNSSGETIAAAGSGDNDLKANELQFNDGGNWVYELNLKAIPPTTVSLMARYGSTEQYLIGGASSYETIMGGSSEKSNKYTITAKYDFKTNRLLTAWIPDGDIEDPLSDVDMIWVRHGNNAADQITFTGSGSLTNADVVGAIELRYDELVGHVASWTPSSRPLLKYFVSFPFDVNVSDVFGLNKAELNRDFKIQKYNGAKRASDGLFAGDGDTYWEDLTMDSVMHKYEGYCVMFDNDYLNGDKGDIWENKTGGSVVYLYFPAKKKVAAITSSDVDTIVPAHDCKIERTFSYGGGTISHKVADSNWNLIGPGLFQNSYVKTSSGAGDSDNTPTWSDNTKLGAYYEWSSYDNKWYIKPLDNSHKDQFKSMSAILVHWAGSITWSKDAPASYIAARRTPEKNNNTLITLELTYNDVVADKAIVKLQEEASSDFVLCEDVLKIINSGKPNIFVYAGDYSAAYSRVPVETQTIPVGVVTRANGTYTFSMPEGINGTVTLIDNFAQTRTNLSIEDYEVYLERGNIYDRFSIEIDVNNAPTAIDGVSGGEGQGTLKDGKAHKFIMNGQMYILENGKLYDVQGRRIE